ncbi:hypothetical protein ILYODFUR_013559 [Ilyodon furcidens]|uniref:Uncharacterized protein n=1 Tax=Ilyodon furcidens TaxID=33524 RepID=A0ABV0TIB6_9TELE
MEQRVKQQSVEVEKADQFQQKVMQEKVRLEVQTASLSAKLQEANKRITMLQKEKEQQSEQHEENVMKLQAKHETDISHLHREHALSAAKATDVIEDLEKTVAHLKQQLQESDYRRHQQVRDQEMKFQQEKDELQANCEKKVLAVHSEAEREKIEAKRKIAKLEDALRAPLMCLRIRYHSVWMSSQTQMRGACMHYHTHTHTHMQCMHTLGLFLYYRPEASICKLTFRSVRQLFPCAAPPTLLHTIPKRSIYMGGRKNMCISHQVLHCVLMC